MTVLNGHIGFEYHPSVDDLGGSLIGLVADRLLLLGGDIEGDLPAVEVRHTTPPEPILANGLYLFRTTTGIDALRCARGRPPARRELCDPTLAPADHPLVRARYWFETFWQQATAVGPAAKFADGDWVTVAGNQRAGRVESTRPVDGTYLYRVRVDGAIQSISEDGLLALEMNDEDARSWLRLAPVPAEELSVSLTVTKLTNPLTDTLYSYLSSKTVFRAYQFRPVLRLLESPHNRLLIADEVGLGKTIEAGLIWTELEARNPSLKRVLIVCPAALVPKWQAEMRNRFDRDLQSVDTEALRELVERLESGDDNKPFVGVVSIERLRSSKVLPELTALHPHFDLVIVDEAHYLRNLNTLSHQLGELLSEWADTLLFLSATPLNLGSDDLFNLLGLLAGDEFSDPGVFPLQIEPNRRLNRVAGDLLASRTDPRSLLPTLLEIHDLALGAAVTGRPEFQELCSLLDTDTLDWEDVSHAKRLLTGLNTLSSILTRTRKVDVPNAKAVREPYEIAVQWTAEERDFYAATRSWAFQRARSLGHVPGFSTQMPLRQAASCLPVMRQRLLANDPTLFRPDPGTDDLDDLAGDVDTDEPQDPLSWEEIRAAALAVGDTDTKLDRFCEVLEQTKLWEGGQVLVFSFFRGTIAYLERHLGQRWRVRSMHGGTKMADRQELMEQFRSGEFDILLASEVASEGLDLEFCNVVVNYDLPWNPMKVEQRIGRLDRFGQEFDKIFVVNFHVPGTIETDIFERLYQRIRVFEESIGELEPILREQVNALKTIALDPELSDEQRERRLDEVAVAVEDRRTDLNDLRETDSLLAGIDRLLIDGLEQDTQNRGRFIGSKELRILLDRFLAECGHSRLHLPAGQDRGELVGDGELADRVSRHAGTSGGSRHRPARLSTMLRDGEPIPVTFDNEVATRSGIDLLSFRHPVVRAAVSWFSQRPAGVHRFGSVRLPRLAPGSWLVVIHLVETTGLQPALELWPVAVDLETGKIDDDVGFAVLAATAQGELHTAPPIEASVLVAAIGPAEDHLHLRQVRTERQRRQTNEALVDARIAAQRASINAKIRRAEEAGSKVEDPRIVRLHEGRAANLRLRLVQAVEQLNSARALSVSTRPVAVISVRGGPGHTDAVPADR